MEKYKLDYTQSSLWKRRGYNKDTFHRKQSIPNNNNNYFFWEGVSSFYTRHISNNYIRVTDKIKNYENLIGYKKNKNNDININTFRF
jgi:hypothetical protein